MTEDSPFLERKARVPGLDLVGALHAAHTRHGRSYASQVAEMIRLARGAGRISPHEYFQFRLYDSARHDPAAKARFFGHRARVPIHRDLIEREWLAVTTDKVLFYAAMAGFGLPIPRTVALYHEARAFGSTPTLRDGPALARWLREAAPYPLFAKPVEGVGSAGAAWLVGVDRASDRVRSADGRTVAVDQLAAEIAAFGGRGYVFQERLAPSPALLALHGDRLSAVRVLIAWEQGRPAILRATWKVPAGTNVADNFWRPGNMVAAVDPETGTVERVVRGTGESQVEVDAHPDTGGRLAGAVLPGWTGVREACLAAARSLAGLMLQGWDVALSDRGPVFLEVEGDGGAQTLTQFATGRGLLDDRFAAFLAEWRVQAAERREKLSGRRRRRP
jgi:hypothetical protein